MGNKATYEAMEKALLKKEEELKALKEDAQDCAAHAVMLIGAETLREPSTIPKDLVLRILEVTKRILAATEGKV